VKRETAYNIAIDAIKEKRRRHALGHKLFVRFDDPPEFTISEDAHYKRLTKAVNILISERDYKQESFEAFNRVKHER
jgi:hypothetical protein